MPRYQVHVEQIYSGSRQTTLVVDAEDEMAAERLAKEMAGRDDDWIADDTDYEPMDALASEIEDDDE